MRRRPGLSRYDRSSDASPQARHARRLASKDPAEYLPLLATPGLCWCGVPFGHDWQGKSEDAPHPRDWPGRVNGHPYRWPL